MNKGELVDAVAERANVTKKQADAVLSAALDSIVDAVSTGDKVTLVGFGSFERRDRKEREGRNPKTNEKMSIMMRTKLKVSNLFRLCPTSLQLRMIPLRQPRSKGVSLSTTTMLPRKGKA